jgi:hypothetical protein
MDFLENSGDEQATQLIDFPAPSAAPRRSPPEVIGVPYKGPANSSVAKSAEVTLKFIVQTNSGDVSGIFQISSKRGRSLVFHFQGAVNREGLFVLHGNAPGERIVVISGNVLHDGDELIGNYVIKEPGLPLTAGTFNVMRVFNG